MTPIGINNISKKTLKDDKEKWKIIEKKIWNGKKS
jgi:hypothetical protein